MTDKTEFNATELEIFAEAKAAGTGLRKSFDRWIAIAKAVQVARVHADRPGGSHMVRGKRFRDILTAQQLEWISRNDGNLLLKMVAQLPAVQRWREGLTNHQRVRWSSPQSVLNRAPCFRDGRPPKGPAPMLNPMTVSQLMKLPAQESAQLLYDRCPSKAWALRRALDELLDAGSAPRPTPGWVADRRAKAAREVLPAA
jgi:hypothetical protein